jgi:hypothetical protein
VSFHEDYTRAVAGKSPSNRRFGFTVGAVLSVLALVPVLRGKGPRFPLLIPGAILIIAAAAFPKTLEYVNRAWTGLGHILAKVVNPLVLGAMFYLVFAPVATVLRLLGKDLLRLRADRHAASYWLERQPPHTASETMLEPF